MLALEKNGIAIDDTSEAGTRYLQATAEELRKSIEDEQKENAKGVKKMKEAVAPDATVRKNVPISVASMRDTAKQFLGDLPEKTATNVQLHLKTLKDLQAKFLKELKSGDKEAALKTRIDQIQQHLVVVESVRLKKELAAVHARLDPTTINAKLKGCDYTGKNVVGHLCNLLGIDGVRQPNKEWTDEAKASNYGSIRQWLSDTQNGLYNFIPNWMWERTGQEAVFKSGKRKGQPNGNEMNLTAGQLLEADMVMRDVLQSSRESKKIDLANLDDNVRAQVALFSRQQDQMGVKPINLSPEKTAGRAIGQRWRNMQNFDTLIQMQADLFDGYYQLKTGKPGAVGAVVRALIDARNGGTKDKNDINAALDKIAYKPFEKASNRLDAEVAKQGGWEKYGQKYMPADLWAKGKRWKRIWQSQLRQSS